MSYREVHVVEVQEVLRLWSEGESLRSIARISGLDRKTVRRYVEAGQASGGRLGELVSEAVVCGAVALVRAQGPGVHGESWRSCEQHRERLSGWVGEGVPLSKVRQLLHRHAGVLVPYRTLHRYARQELGVGGQRVTVRVADGEPGEELQLDFGAVGWIEQEGRRRRVWALVLTAVFSRHQYVWLCYRQRVADVIAGCEAAWAFFGGVFRVLVPDNLKAIVASAHRESGRLNPTFLEYAQTRGFTIDPARVRHPQDKGRVERAVRYVQGSLFAGESFATLEQAQAAADPWCRTTAGLRLHGTTQQRPLEHFEREELQRLLPKPEEPYEVALWVQARVQRDHHLLAAKALYSVPTAYIGERVEVRLGKDLVRVYHRGQPIKTHPRMAPGGRSTDPADYPIGVREYACRDQASLLARAQAAGVSVGAYAQQLLCSTQPWTRLRHVYRLLRLVHRYGEGSVEQACARALAAEVIDVTRVTRMLELGVEGQPMTARPHSAQASATSLRFLRQASEYRVTVGGGHD